MLEMIVDCIMYNVLCCTYSIAFCQVSIDLEISTECYLVDVQECVSHPILISAIIWLNLVYCVSTNDYITIVMAVPTTVHILDQNQSFINMIKYHYQAKCMTVTKPETYKCTLITILVMCMDVWIVIASITSIPFPKQEQWLSRGV